jgi:hypothetical protein
MVDFPKMRRVEVPRCGSGFEPYALIVVTTQEEFPGGDDLVSQEGWRSVENDQVDGSAYRLLEMRSEAIGRLRRRHNPEEHRDIDITPRALLPSTC